MRDLGRILVPACNFGVHGVGEVFGTMDVAAVATAEFLAYGFVFGDGVVGVAVVVFDVS